MLAWLLGEARRLPDANALLTGLCGRLLASGVPLAWASFNMQLLHPHLFGVGIYWRRGAAAVQVFGAARGIERTATFLNSPMGALYEGAGGVRQRLDLPGTTLPFPLLHNLRAEGLTDYVALPLIFSDGKVHGTSWASDRPGGFATGDLALIESILPAVSLLLEIHVNRRLAITLLDTYVGHSAGGQILEGQITRGSGETVLAAIWYCDLRGFTELSERTERDVLIALLNAYFDCMAAPVARHGGEILKFIGDAMLAIFPMDADEACARALEAAIEARGAMAELNQRRRERGHAALGFGLALHVGEVMYGNIGASDRLDFTVVGPAVNLATRIERLCRTLGRDILMSKTFSGMCGSTLPSLGAHRVAGVAYPVEVFTLPEAA
ncbi:MAG: adenylate/guanylate cyclase domain-containing protein [Geminicoccaceae bacterium]